jgi:poly(3-hydroxybutyrate) depolymerase
MTKTLTVLLLLTSTLTAVAEDMPAGGSSEYVYGGWEGHAINVRLYVPGDVSASTPIVIVMHGASRDAPRYYEDWRKAGDVHGFIVVVPYFSKEFLPTSDHYNLGFVFDPETGKMREGEQWTFAAIEPLFDDVVRRVGGEQTHYTLYGHSAGSQFVHRFLFYVPDARVKRAIAANAGWYTMPDYGIDFPYGLRESGVTEDALISALSRDVVILLGDADTITDQENLNQAPEAELQGQHRFDRGNTFFRVSKYRAELLGVPFGWRLLVVPGAGHSNAQMTPRAAELVE